MFAEGLASNIVDEQGNTLLIIAALVCARGGLGEGAVLLMILCGALRRCREQNNQLKIATLCLRRGVDFRARNVR